MRAITTWLLMTAISLQCYAQQTLHGKVYDIYTQVPVKGAFISADGKILATTDVTGNFNLDCNNSYAFTVMAAGYDPQTVQGKDGNKQLMIGLTAASYNLNEITVNAATAKGNLLVPKSVAILTRQDLQRNDGLFFENTLNLVPGVRMEKRTMSGGQRITIRGYGNGTNFNGTGYKAYLNGIPVTDAEGTTILDDIDFSILGRVEVIKGPASSLYGSGIGGVLKMYTLKPATLGTRITQEALAGSYGLFRTNTRVEYADDKSSVMLNYGHQNYDSYRINSASKKDFVSFIGDFHPNDKQTFSVYTAYNSSNDQLAGQLDSIQFAQKKDTGEVPYLNNHGYVAFETYRAGLSHNYAFSSHVSNLTSAYFSGYKQSQAFAVGLSSNMVQNLGARTALGLNFAGNAITWNGTIGAEYQKTNSFKKSYGLANNVPGALGGDLELATMQYNIFTQWEIKLPQGFTVTAGVSNNYIEYGITDRLANSANPTHKDQSGHKTFTPVVTPQITVLKSLNEAVSVYAGVSKGYSAPTSGQVIIPQISQVNKDLQPEKSIQYEVGAKGNLLQERLSFQLAVFDMEIKDKLTSQAITDNTGTVLYTVTSNAGGQQNRGAEVDLAYTIRYDKPIVFSLIRPFISYTYSNFTYDHFKSDNNNNPKTIDYSGNKASGVAPHLFNGGIDFITKWGVYLNTTLQYVDKMPITYDNNHYADAYTLLQAKLGYKHSLGKHFNLDVFAGGNNITGSRYYTMVFLNANFSGATPNIYLPGPYKATWYSGFNLSYKF
ncbi:iron complex outermembrane receptor protein [Chitinophaga niastensis]|uniref:Iron complex outermembrane receptor protein n=1 Tax=Chitinophaga niastensis TaxID=536980 RepID=A0A2P8HJE9_CHINA|nr:TonB-dependent receptor [Chitinophaga niastensis]PSL46344.1 iron complex outermembrane receptor protein [Chitinophaga niastensis]